MEFDGKSEASGAEDENEKTMREDKERNERKGVSLSPPAALETGTGVAAAKKKKPATKRRGRREKKTYQYRRKQYRRKEEEDGEGKEEKKTIESILEALKTELHRFFRSCKKPRLEHRGGVSRVATVRSRRRRRFRDLRRRAKALKDGLSTEDKNVLRAAGVLVGAILAVNVSNAIVGGRSRAPLNKSRAKTLAERGLLREEIRKDKFQNLYTYTPSKKER